MVVNSYTYHIECVTVYKTLLMLYSQMLGWKCFESLLKYISL